MSHIFQVIELAIGERVTNEPENGLRYIVQRTDSGPKYGILTNRGPEYFHGLGNHQGPVSVHSINPSRFLHISAGIGPHKGAEYWLDNGRIMASIAKGPAVSDLFVTPFDEYVNSRHSMWYLDNHQLDTVRGVVLEYYGARNTYRMPGVTFSFDDSRVDYDPFVQTDENGTVSAYSLYDTAMYADDMARIISERERYYNEGLDAFLGWEEIGESLRFLRDDIRDAIHTYRKAPSPWLHRTITEMWSERSRLQSKREDIALYYSHNPGFTSQTGYNEGFTNPSEAP